MAFNTFRGFGLWLTVAALLPASFVAAATTSVLEIHFTTGAFRELGLTGPTGGRADPVTAKFEFPLDESLVVPGARLLVENVKALEADLEIDDFQYDPSNIQASYFINNSLSGPVSGRVSVFMEGKPFGTEPMPGTNDFRFETQFATTKAQFIYSTSTDVKSRFVSETGFPVEVQIKASES